MQRPQASEAGPGQIEIEHRVSELPGDDVADEKTHHPPEHRGDDTGADHAIGITDLLPRLFLVHKPLQQIDAGETRGDQEQQPVKHHGLVLTGYGKEETDHGAKAGAEQRHDI